MANKVQKRTTNRKNDATMSQTWNKITGIARVYGNTFDTPNGGTITKWSITISGKPKDGDEYKNYYVPVKFAGKDANEPDTDELHVIDISNAFLSLDIYTNKKGVEVLTPCLVVTANEVVE